MVLSIFRLTILSVVLFGSGLIIGWWFHDRFPSPLVIAPDSRSLTKGTIIEPFKYAPEEGQKQPVSTKDLDDFKSALEENRSEDALTIYQSHESTDSELLAELRKALFQQIELWSVTHNTDNTSAMLERFTQYYYQDVELLKKLASVYETSIQLDKAIETYLYIRQYTQETELSDFLDEKVHSLAKKLYEQQKQRQTLELIIPLLQKLAWLEPDYAFYRFALANSYISIDDTDSAIRELELLQLDPEFGNRAYKMLAKLLPPPPQEDPEEPAGIIPLAGSGGHFIAGVNVGKYPVQLLIDTGSSLTTLPARVIQNLRKDGKATRIAHVEMQTANGKRLSPLYKLKEFQIGNYFFNDLEVVELDLGLAKADGLLGMDVLGKFHFVIDQNRLSLTLTPR